jgi:hypothetical protein
MRWQDLPLNPQPTTLRWFSLYAACFLFALAVSQYWRERELAALVLLAAAIVVGCLGILRPALLRPVFVGALVATFPLGWLVSRLLLALIFFGIFTPLGFLFRCLGRDALALRICPEASTYWKDKPPASDVASYFRQS